MNFYQQLLDATTSERHELLTIPFIVEGAAGKLGLASYQAFLAQAYHHVKHTVPLLMATGARLPERLEWLREAVGEYIEEEMGHQEWILDDLAATGADPEAVRNSEPLPATELMVAYAWDTIHRRNPVGFFGMVLVLEGTSVTLATQAAGNIRSALGLPPDAFRYLTSHGSLDEGHISFYENLVNRLDAPEDRQAVIHAARMFYRLYGDIFRSLPMIPLDAEENNDAVA